MKIKFNRVKDKYTPAEWRATFSAMYYLKIPFSRKLIKEVHKLWDIPSTLFMERYRSKVGDFGHKDEIRIPNIKDKYLKREFLFQGFVPEDKYPRRQGFAYIISVSSIEGKRYIYPKPLVYGQGNKDFPNIWQTFKGYGIPGYTKILF